MSTFEEILYCKHQEKQTDINIQIIEKEMDKVTQRMIELVGMKKTLEEQKVGVQEYRKSLYNETIVG